MRRLRNFPRQYNNIHEMFNIAVTPFVTDAEPTCRETPIVMVKSVSSLYAIFTFLPLLAGRAKPLKNRDYKRFLTYSTFFKAFVAVYFQMRIYY